MEKNLPALLDTGAVTVTVSFQAESIVPYTYVSNIKGLAVGDYVTVPTKPNGNGRGTVLFDGDTRISVGIVRKVDADVQIEPNAEIEYRWVIGKVDLAPYKSLMERNKTITTMVTEAYKNNMRQSFAQQIMGGLAEDKKDKLLALLS